MTFTTLWANDNWATSRAALNNNFTDAQTQLDTKVQYSGTIPADWDLIVASGITGKVIKKKVFTASQILESDASGQPVSAAKGTAYNKNFGVVADTVLQGNNDALYAKLAGTQTITGDKTFSGALTIPSATIATTQTAWDSSTKVATTAFVQSATGAFKNWTTTKNLTDASGTQNIAHGLGVIPKCVRLMFADQSNNLGTNATLVYNWTTSSVVWRTWTNTTRINPNVGGSIRVTSDSDSTWNQTWVVTFDATNIIITWTRSGSPSNTIDMLWEAII